MRIIYLCLFSSFYLLCMTFLSSCGLVSKESVYEGIRQQQSQSSTQHPNSQSRELPKYPEYEKERESLKK